MGREPETEALLAGLGDATSGRGRFFVLGGEPGIGKARLADEFSTRAKAEGVLVLWGRCWEAGGAPAYWPWIQSLRGLLRELDPEALRERVAGGGADLAQMLPELRERLPDLSEPPPASPGTARFRLFDALSGFAASTKLFTTTTAVDETGPPASPTTRSPPLRDALVDSKPAQRILSSLSPKVRERVIDAAREAFTSGVATTIKAAALVALVAAGLVMVLWPRPAGGPHAPNRHCQGLPGKRGP